MPHLSQRDLSLLRDVTESLRPLRLDGRSEWADITQRLMAESGANFIMLNRVAPTTDSWRLDFFWVAGGAGNVESDFLAFLCSGAPAVTLYDPIRPAPNQRNVVLTTDAVLARNPVSGPLPLERLADRHGFRVAEQVRALVCDGPLLLGWFGGAWPTQLQWKGAQLLRGLLPMVRERLLIDRAFANAPLYFAALQTTLEELAVPAFVVRHAGNRIIVELCNSAGAALMERGAADLSREIRAGLERPDAPGPFQSRPLSCNGLTQHSLVIRRGCTDPGGRAAIAAQRIGATRRQAEVLQLVMLGHTNRTIAELLRCTERTVEVHVSALLDKTGADSRSQLVARVWMISSD